MAPCVSKKCACTREIARQETGERATREHREQSDQVLSLECSGCRKPPRLDGPDATRQTIHVIEKIHRIRDCNDPQDSHEITERLAGDKKCYANPRRRDKQCND